MDMVKANAAQLLKQLRPADIISVVSFNDRAEIIVPPTAVRDLGKLENTISMLRQVVEPRFSRGSKLY